MVFLVVRMKGTVNVPYWARITLDSLHLNKRFRATIIPENEQTLGMLRKIKEFVSWASVDDVFVREFVEKKGRVSSTRLLTASTNSAASTPTETGVPDNADDQINNSNNKNNGSLNTDLGKIVSIIFQNEVYLSKISGIKPWFALNPPKGGFKRKSKRSYSQNGILGENKELVSIVKRMM
jgi:large subunit ribosomal protein L30